jgi:hypothetical protein
MMARKTPSPHIAALGTPRFEFNLHYVRINAVHRLCRERNVNFMEYIRSVGNHVYYNRTFNVENPDWELLADEHLADPTRENYGIVYFPNSQIVHWGFTLVNLRSYAHQMPYTSGMMANCLRRLIQTHEPEIFCRTLACH